MTFFQKFLSRKFLTGLIASLFLVFEAKLGLELDLETKLIVAGLASTWILGETWLDASHVDKVKAPEQRMQSVLAALNSIKPLLPPGVDPLQMIQALLGKLLGDLHGAGKPPDAVMPEPFVGFTAGPFAKPEQE